MSTTITVPTVVDHHPTETWQVVRIAPLPNVCAVCLEPAEEIFEVTRWVTVNGEKAQLVVPVPLCAEDCKTACWESPNELLVTRASMGLGALLSLAFAAYLFFDTFASAWYLRFTLPPLACVGLSIGAFELVALFVKPRFVNPKTKLVRETIRVGEFNEGQRRAQLIVSNEAYAKRISSQPKSGTR